MKTVRRSLVFFFLLASGFAHAQIPTAVVELDEALTRTLSLNPLLQALGYQMQMQDALVLQAGIKPLPELLVETENFLGTGENQLFSGLNTTFSISWILDRGIRQTQISAASARTPVIELEIDIARLDSVAETARRYLQCLVLQTRMMSAQEGIRLAENAVTEIDQRVNSGIAPRAELARANAELARRELAREDIEHELLSAYYRLGAQWGEVQPSFSRVAGDIFNLPEIETFEVLQTQLQQNPDLEIFLSQQRLNEAQLRFEQAKNRQNWRVSAGFRRLEANSDNAFVASFSMPIGQQNINRGNIAAARTNMLMTELEAEAERVRLETELFVIYQELQHSVQLTESLRTEILPLYQLALEETQTAFELGRYSYLEWNAAQTDLLSAQNDLIDASMGIYRNLIEIERLTGVSIIAPQLTP